MKITILQRNIEWANPQANVARADEAISCLPDSDLFVLPEMFSTGFCTQPEGIAESADSETLHWMKRKAAERNCAIAGSTQGIAARIAKVCAIRHFAAAAAIQHNEKNALFHSLYSLLPTPQCGVIFRENFPMLYCITFLA